LHWTNFLTVRENIQVETDGFILLLWANGGGGTDSPCQSNCVGRPVSPPATAVAGLKRMGDALMKAD
jgi:hypothetical protein